MYFRGELVAVKRHHSARTAERERAALRLVGPHPRVVALVADIPGLGACDVALSRAAMDLFDLAATGAPRPPTPALIGCLADAAEGLAHVHAAGVVHGDVKPENVLLRAEGAQWRAELCDFASARLPTEEAGGAELGTLRYCAPEVLEAGCREALSPAGDCFALGVTACVVLRREHPWAEAREDDPWYRAFDGSHFASAFTTPSAEPGGPPRRWEDPAVDAEALAAAGRAGVLCAKAPAARPAASRAREVLLGR